MAVASVRSFWGSQRKWLKTWYVKLLASVALVMGVATAVTNIWGVRALNHSAVPSATVSVSRLLNREVCLCSCHQSWVPDRSCAACSRRQNHAMSQCLFYTPPAADETWMSPWAARVRSTALCVAQISVGRVKWASPIGVLGIGPLAAVGPVSVGPSAAGLERSSLEASAVVVRVDPLQSAAQARIVISLHINDSKVPLAAGPWQVAPQQACTPESARGATAGRQQASRAPGSGSRMRAATDQRCCPADRPGAGRKLVLVRLPR